jgi:hypothetical protein
VKISNVTVMDASVLEMAASYADVETKASGPPADRLCRAFVPPETILSRDGLH